MKKILVIGGAYQGKTKWVKEKYKEYQAFSPERILQENRSGKWMSGIWINQFHLLTKQWLKEGKLEENAELLRNNPSWIVVANEIGNGIVPIDPFERKWREETGRVLCKLAKDADEVYRVYCGIPTLIKGGNASCYTHSMHV